MHEYFPFQLWKQCMLFEIKVREGTNRTLFISLVTLHHRASVAQGTVSLLCAHARVGGSQFLSPQGVRPHAVLASTSPCPTDVHCRHTSHWGAQACLSLHSCTDSIVVHNMSAWYGGAASVQGFHVAGRVLPATCAHRVCALSLRDTTPCAAQSALDEALPRPHAECSNPESVISCLHFVFLPDDFF